MQPGDDLDAFSLGMVSNNRIPGLLPLLFTQMNNERQFLYNVTSKVSLRQYISGKMTRDKCIKAFEGIAEAFLSCGEYMLSTSSLLTDPDFIYINVGTGEASLVCLPTLGRKELDDMPGYFKSILCRMVFSEEENIDYPAMILNFLNRSGNFSLPEFRSFLNTIKKQPDNGTPQTDQIRTDTEDQNTGNDPSAKQSIISKGKDSKSGNGRKGNAERKIGFDLLSLFDCFTGGKKAEKDSQAGINFAVPGLQARATETEDKPRPNKEPVFLGGTTYLTPDGESERTMLLRDSGPPPSNPEPYLIRLRTNEKVMIRGETFKIGKEKSYVDYFVENNATVSRSHADIVRREYGFRIIDNNSTNHTYVNGRQIPSNEEVPLEDGARILLGSEEFTFHIT